MSNIRFNWLLPHTLLLCLMLASLTSYAEGVHEGKVVKIADGDTLTLLVESQQHKIRLSDIDTPERKQPFGTRAKQALADLAFGKQARVVEVAVDRYGRIVGRVYVDGVDVNRKLVAGGFAWVYRRYSDDAELLELEAQAQEKRRGLWADPNPIYRRGSGGEGGENETVIKSAMHRHSTSGFRDGDRAIEIESARKEEWIGDLSQEGKRVLLAD